MESASAAFAQGETPASHVTVRYWASARAVSGVSEERLAVSGPVTLDDVRRLALAAHPDADRLPEVLAVCSVLIGDVPAGRADAGATPVPHGSVVEFLPPFAGG